MRLPELLVEGGVIDAVTVEQVLEAQSLYGGSFDTNLLEEGVISERALQPFLEQAFQVKNQIDVLAEPAKDAVARLPRRQAETARICPMRLAGRTLDVVVTDPTDVRAVDEIGFVTGCRIAVNVGCESRVAYLLNRAYNIPIAHRHLALVQGKVWPKPDVAERRMRAKQKNAGEIDVPITTDDVPGEMPGISIPGVGNIYDDVPPAPAQPPAHTPTFAPMVWTPVTMGAPPPPMVRSIPKATVQLQQEVLPPLPPLTPAVRVSAPMAAVAPPPHHPPPSPAANGTAPPLEPIRRSYDVIAAQLQSVEEKDHIPPIALGYLATLLTRVVLFSVRKADLHGWDARGRRLRREIVETLSFPLDQPSVFAAVANGGEPYEGPLPRGPIEETFVIKLGGDVWPEYAIVAPVRVHNRTAAVLYGEAASRAAVQEAREPVETLAHLIGEALVQLIIMKKQGG